MSAVGKAIHLQKIGRKAGGEQQHDCIDHQCKQPQRYDDERAGEKFNDGRMMALTRPNTAPMMNRSTI